MCSLLSSAASRYFSFFSTSFLLSFMSSFLFSFTSLSEGTGICCVRCCPRKRVHAKLEPCVVRADVRRDPVVVILPVVVAAIPAQDHVVQDTARKHDVVSVIRITDLHWHPEETEVSIPCPRVGLVDEVEVWRVSDGRLDESRLVFFRRNQKGPLAPLCCARRGEPAGRWWCAASCHGRPGEHSLIQSTFSAKSAVHLLPHTPRTWTSPRRCKLPGVPLRGPPTRRDATRADSSLRRELANLSVPPADLPPRPPRPP